jgi:hypothetical protein
MTSSVINTYVTNTTETLTSTGDDLLVTSAGSIVNTNGDIGVYSQGESQNTTIDGLVYSVDDGNGVGVEMTGAGSNLFVNGQVQGDQGVLVDDTTSVNVNIGAQGSVEGVNGEGVIFEGNINSPAATGCTLNNAGEISAGFGFIAHAVSFQYGGYDLLINSGTISGAFAVSYFDEVGTETVENSGTIEGGSGGDSSAIQSTTSSAGVDIVNSGLITDGARNTIGSVYALIYFDDAAGVASTIDNEGTITGAGYVIQSISDSLDISNSGTIHGGIYATGTVDIVNSGIWQESTGHSSGVFSLSGAGDTIANTGTIVGDINLTGSTDTLTNDGRINGDITLGQHATLTNTGTIHGNVVLAYYDTIDTSEGKITGTVKATKVDTFDFSGSFGHNTITGFVATNNAHDTIHFLSDDFANYAAVQSHMAQVGTDVVITLDAADTIVLESQTLANLTSSDFTFG